MLPKLEAAATLLAQTQIVLSLDLQVRKAARVSLMIPLDVKLTTEPLSRFDLEFSDRDGALVDFFGVVRGIENEQPIDGIEYQAFVEMPEIELKRFAEIARKHFFLGLFLFLHRLA